MRGYPPLQILIVAVAFCLLAVPLWKLTWGAEAPVQGTAIVTEQPTHLTDALLTVRCAHAPESLQLLTDKGVLATWKKDASWPQSVSLKIDKTRPLEIAVTAKWPDSVSSTAVTLELLPQGLPAGSETLWSDGPEMDNVFTFNPSARP